MVLMPHNHATHAPRCVVHHARPLGLQHRLQFPQDGREGFQDLGVGLGFLLQQTDGEGGVGFRLGVFVAEAVEEELQQCGCRGRDCGAHATDAFCDRAHRGAALDVLAAAGELQDALLEDLEELGEGGAEGGGEADDGVEGAVDDEPVVFGGFFEVVVFGLEAEVGLAGVGAAEQVQESFGQGFEDGGRGD
jgi:hypothetical protein